MSDHALMGFTPPAQSPARRRDGSAPVPAGRPQLGPGGGVGRGSGTAAPQTSLWNLMRLAWRRHHSRQSLLGLSDHLRKDIGISYADAEAEGNKPFWIG